MDLIYRFNNNEAYILSKDVYDISFVSEIYSSLIESSYMSKDTNLDIAPHVNYSLLNRKVFYLDDSLVNNYDKIYKIIEHFNIVIKNSLVQKNSSILKTKFDITLNSIKLNITQPLATTSEIFKRNCLSVIIPVTDLSINQGTISIFNTLDSDNNIIDLSLNLQINDEEHTMNYGHIEEYDVNTKSNLVQNEIFFDFHAGDVIVIKDGVYSRLLPNNTDEQTMYLELEYDISL
jgi:hypothetical protein